MAKTKLIARCIKAATAVIVSAAVLEEINPYLTLFILALGAVANEITEHFRDIEKSG
jgi:histone H3/H4